MLPLAATLSLHSMGDVRGQLLLQQFHKQHSACVFLLRQLHQECKSEEGKRDFVAHCRTWLILPVVICLSQRLSHARVSINFSTVRLRMAHYNSCNLSNVWLLDG